MDLPKVFQNNNIIIDNHDQEVFYSRKNNLINESYNIKEKINNLFSNKQFIYKVNTEITLNDKTITTTIIGKNSEYLITINNELIPIKNIKDIKKLDS